MTAAMAVMKQAVSGPAPAPSSDAPAVAASQTTGLVMETMTVETTVMRTQPAEADQHVTMTTLPFKLLQGN